MDARSLTCRINVGEKLILMHTKYILCGPLCVKEDDFYHPHLKSMGAICYHGNKSSNQISKHICPDSPYLMILNIKFDQKWSTDLIYVHL